MIPCIAAGFTSCRKRWRNNKRTSPFFPASGPATSSFSGFNPERVQSQMTLTIKPWRTALRQSTPSKATSTSSPSAPADRHSKAKSPKSGSCSPLEPGAPTGSPAAHSRPGSLWTTFLQAQSVLKTNKHSKFHSKAKFPKETA